MARTRDIWLEARDGAKLSATLFEASAKAAKAIIIIAAATASPQTYYRRFASATASDEWDVLTFDYRGVGRSLHTRLKYSRAKMTDWGMLDLDAAIRWAKSSGYQNIYLLGHSVAGQIFPLAENAHRVKAAYFVGSQTAAQRYWHGFSKFKVWIFWFILIPTLTRLYGYLPGWSMGGKVGIPSTTAWEWRTWGKHPQGVLQGLEDRKQAFAEIDIPMKLISLEHDNTLAPRAAVEALMTYYPQARTSHEHLLAKSYNADKLGHFDFFRSRFKDSLWPKPVDFFREHNSG